MTVMDDSPTSAPYQRSDGTDGPGFGPNIWIVDQMYRRFVEDPSSVSESWRDFFADYTPALALEPAPPAAPQTAPPAAGASAAAPAPSPAGPKAEEAEERAGEPAAGDDETIDRIVGPGAVIAERMAESRDLPTATSVRTFPAKLLEVNRRILNNQLARRYQGGKVSFTHLIGWAMVRALQDRPIMNAAFRMIDGQPHIVRHDHINLGLAMDMERKDGSRTLLVPNIKRADEMDFQTFWRTYEDVVLRARTGKITPDDFAGTTATLTNPGTVGTVQSVPRLMAGQGLIVGVGAIGYPAEYEASDPTTLSRSGVGRVLTMTSTYDHRIIQGAESGLFLQRLHHLLLGADGFYDDIFRSMSVPYVPARWARDDNPPQGTWQWAEKQARVFQLINIYRVRGHLIADLDPLRQKPPAMSKELDPLTYGLTIWDLEREFATGGLGGPSRMTLGSILGLLRDAYCRTVGIEYMHIQEPDQKRWIQEHVERPTEAVPLDTKRRILRKLNEAEAFERFLHTKFLGAKRFSLEGGESFIPLMDTVLNAAADSGMSQVVIGMAHRGRLNVLANTVGKSLVQIFREFEGEADDLDPAFSGDVKYHLGAKGSHVAPSGMKVAVTVAANPSHLEAVDPVLEGIARAKQDAIGDGAEELVLPVLVHGDAAFAGQGVVAETLNLSQLPAYHTGGTVHIVINNQVGFTTAAAESRSSFYATDTAKAVQAPIFHVNGDDPEAVVQVARLAFAFRQTFRKDVVIDMVCYRRLGHNEGDEPSYTQPRMYSLIEDHRSVRKVYMERLVNRGDISVEEGEAVLEEFRALLDQALEEMRSGSAVPPRVRSERPDPRAPVPTAIGDDRMRQIEERLRHLPDGFTVHPKLRKQLDDRNQVFADGQADWAWAEALAFGSLALDGRPVRLAGEDSQRGTFSHRHAVLVDYRTEEEYMPLAHLDPGQAPVVIVDTLLSEFAAMGFEYGYSVENPNALVLWEAQFGDFVNGAQVVIDQFLVSGEDKWDQRSGLTLLLPHGFEGQGPEHSHARIERFLSNAAEDNLRVAVPTTTTQYFHLLRRQGLHPAQKPLIVFTPKSLLRTRESFGAVADIASGSFHPVLDDVRDGVRRVVLCSGKVFYDLARYRDKESVDDVALVRVEQLYPFPEAELAEVLDRYDDAELYWVQEEPANMGAWRYMARRVRQSFERPLVGVSRPESASPATGNPRKHAREQAEIVEAAFD
jgi:multifunctional 2-oxoglutarate metabolism enzyme